MMHGKSEENAKCEMGIADLSDPNNFAFRTPQFDMSPESLYRRVVAYLRTTRHVVDEDMVQEMVMLCLEREGDPTDLRWVYLRALDLVHPRHLAGGRRVRPTLEAAQHWSPQGPPQRLYSSDEQATFIAQHQHAPVAPQDALLEHLPARGELRAKLLLRVAYGYSEAEIARLWGVAESRISQQLGGGRAAILLGQVPEGPLPIPGLEWEVAWIRF